MEKVRPWCGQPSDRGRLRNRNRTDNSVTTHCFAQLWLFASVCWCRFYRLVKDFCGVVSEASVRSNLILIMELLSEYLVSCCAYLLTVL